MDFLTAIKDWFVEFGNKFYNTFIVENRWTYLLNGLGTTLLITAFALVIGIILGFIVAIIRSTNQRTGKLKVPNFICRIYLTVFRGTPMVVQLLIIYFVILAQSTSARCSLPSSPSVSTPQLTLLR